MFKLGSSPDAVRDFNPDYYIKSGQLDNDDNIISKKYILKNEREIDNGLDKKLGIKSIVIKENKIELEFGAKVLRKNYAELMHKNNIEQVLDNINATGLIELDKNEFIDSAEVYKCDVTCNLPVTKSSDVYLRDISILGTKRKYKEDAYKSGFVLTNKAKTKDERLIAYDKLKDFEKKEKWTREILKHIDIKDFEHNHFRIEGNYRTFDTMREYFHFKKHNLDILKFKNKGTIMLADVLLSDANPNYELFNKMLSNEPDLTGGFLLELLDSNEALYKIEKQIGRAEIIKHCNYDLMNIKRLISSKVKGNISQYLREYELLLKRLRVKVKELSNYDNINEVRELLKVA